MINKVIAIYPGRFQPFSKHHADAFKWLQSKFGSSNTYIVTSDIVTPPKSPFNFSEKKAIISSYGLGDRLVQVKNPYIATELMAKFDPKTTAVVFMVGDKDMKEDPRFKIGTKKDGSPTYFQLYDKNKQGLQGFDVHGYLIVAPHINMDVPGYGELSGTTARKALGDTTKSRDQKKELFKGIFGWEPSKNIKLSQMIFDKLESLKEARLFSKEWWNTSLSLTEDVIEDGYMTPKLQKKHNKKINNLQQFLDKNVGRPFEYSFKNFPKTIFGVNVEDLKENRILKEGGAGGHMAHPFNVEWVHTGKDLVKVFQMSINYLKKSPAAVKIDGINASIRLITLDGKKQFVMDRGSNKPLDVKGITKAELTSRFGEGHGMIKIGGTVLDIFNQAIPNITSQLKKLGLWDNPNILFNIEYVAGSSNVLSYDKNFLAIHGLLEIAQVTPTKRSTKEIKYNSKDLQELLDSLMPVAAKHGYEVLGTIPTTLTGDPNLSAELGKKYSINFGDREETKTLSQWLSTAKVDETKVKTKDGKIISSLSKEVLIKISDNTPLPDFVLDPKDYKLVIDGYVIYLATMKLGDAILEKLSSPLGPVSDHEGIVIRDPKISKEPFKITGKFILGGLASSFKK